MDVFWIDVQVKTAEAELEIGVTQGLRVLAEEEVGKKQESEAK
jgi:hypothetical protein